MPNFTNNNFLKFWNIFYQDYNNRWKASHGENYPSNNTDFTINIEDASDTGGGFYSVRTNTIGINSDSKSILAHELSHALRSNLGNRSRFGLINWWNRRTNGNVGTKRESFLLQKAYPYLKNYTLYNARDAGEDYSMNTELRYQIAKKILGEDIQNYTTDNINKAIDDISDDDLYDLYYNGSLGYIETPEENKIKMSGDQKNYFNTNILPYLRKALKEVAYND